MHGRCDYGLLEVMLDLGTVPDKVRLECLVSRVALVPTGLVWTGTFIYTLAIIMDL